jgi:hypothetical protein
MWFLKIFHSKKCTHFYPVGGWWSVNSVENLVKQTFLPHCDCAISWNPLFDPHMERYYVIPFIISQSFLVYLLSIQSELTQRLFIPIMG